MFGDQAVTNFRFMPTLLDDLVLLDCSATGLLQQRIRRKATSGCACDCGEVGGDMQFPVWNLSSRERRMLSCGVASDHGTFFSLCEGIYLKVMHTGMEILVLPDMALGQAV